MMKKKVMLITPPYHCGVVESAGRWPNLGFLYIGGELEKHGYEIDFYDAMSKFHDYDQIRERIRSTQPDFIGVTAITATIVDAVKVLEVAKEEIPGIITIIGGVMSTEAEAMGIAVFISGCVVWFLSFCIASCVSCRRVGFVPFGNDRPSSPKVIANFRELVRQ